MPHFPAFYAKHFTLVFISSSRALASSPNLPGEIVLFENPPRDRCTNAKHRPRLSREEFTAKSGIFVVTSTGARRFAAERRSMIDKRREYSALPSPA
jgi:hypothetical protein